MSACRAVFDTFELLEAILLELPVYPALRTCQVSRTWCDVLARSISLRRNLFEDGMPETERYEDETDSTKTLEALHIDLVDGTLLILRSDRKMSPPNRRSFELIVQAPAKEGVDLIISDHTPEIKAYDDIQGRVQYILTAKEGGSMHSKTVRAQPRNGKDLLSYLRQHHQHTIYRQSYSSIYRAADTDQRPTWYGLRSG